MARESSTKLQDHLAYPPRALRAERAAAYLAMSKSTFLKLVSERVLPKPVEIGGMRMWDRLDLDAAFDDLKSEYENQIDKLLGIPPNR
jgi:predicted DNA-binding transcriptional regulator AlpA